jgi:hypothetical protein
MRLGGCLSHDGAVPSRLMPYVLGYAGGRIARAVYYSISKPRLEIPTEVVCIFECMVLERKMLSR